MSDERALAATTEAIWDAMLGSTDLSNVLVSFDEAAQTATLSACRIIYAEYFNNGQRSFEPEDANYVVSLEHLAKLAGLGGRYDLDDDEDEAPDLPVFASSTFRAPPAMTHSALNRTTYAWVMLTESGTLIEAAEAREPVTHVLDLLGREQWVSTDRGLVPQQEPSSRARRVVILHWCLEILRSHLGIAEEFDTIFSDFLVGSGSKLNRKAAGIANTIAGRSAETVPRLAAQIVAVQEMIEVLQSKGPEWSGSGWTKLIHRPATRAPMGSSSLDYLVTTEWSICLGEVDVFAEAKRVMTLDVTDVEMWPEELSCRKGVEAAICALSRSTTVGFYSYLRRFTEDSNSPLAGDFVPEAMRPWRTLHGRRRSEIVSRMTKVLFAETRRDEAGCKAKRS